MRNLAGGGLDQTSRAHVHDARDSYTYIHPVTGEEKTVDGMDVLAIVKAVADRRWQLSLPAEPGDPEA